MVTDPAFVSRNFCSMPNHHTLKAWQHAQRLAVDCAKIAQSFRTMSNTTLPTSYVAPRIACR